MKAHWEAPAWLWNAALALLTSGRRDSSFDVNRMNSQQNQTSGCEFGVYGVVLTQPRIQQFSLRYSF